MTARITRGEVAALILAGHIRQGLPYPDSIVYYDDGADFGDRPVLGISAGSTSACSRWVDYLGIKADPERSIAEGAGTSLTAFGAWHGWQVQMRGTDPDRPFGTPPLADDVEQLLDDVLAGVEVSS